MGLFSKKKKQKVPEKLNIPIPTDFSAPKLPTKPPEMPLFVEESVSDNKLKEAIKADLPPKTEFNAQQVNEDIKYIDEILDNDLDLNSNEIGNALTNQSSTEEPIIEPKQEIKKEETNLQTEVHPELKKKLAQHDEVIHINVKDDELKPIEDIRPTFSRENPVTPIKKQETSETNENLKGDNVLPEFDDHSKELEEKTKEIIERFKQRKKITGDLFVKLTIYREVLHTNLALKEDAKLCTNKIEAIKRTINSQSKRNNELKANLEFIQDNLMHIEEKLFNKNPYLR